MENDNREALLRKLRGLASKTIGSGCTEAEALAAAAMLGKMMDRYGFDQADLSERDRDRVGCVTQEVVMSAASYKLVDTILTGIMRYCDCKCWHVTRGNSESVYFFGAEPDAMLAVFLTKMMETAIESEWLTYRRAGGATLDPASNRYKMNIGLDQRKSFSLGMKSRLYQRLVMMKEERSKHVDEETGRTGQSLVILKGAVVDQEFAKLNMNLRSARKNTRSTKVEMSAFSAGREAANKVNITTAIR